MAQKTKEIITSLGIAYIPTSGKHDWYFIKLLDISLDMKDRRIIRYKKLMGLNNYDECKTI